MELGGGVEGGTRCCWETYLTWCTQCTELCGGCCIGIRRGKKSNAHLGGVGGGGKAILEKSISKQLKLSISYFPY